MTSRPTREQQELTEYHAALAKLVADQDAKLKARGAYRMEASRNFVAYLKHRDSRDGGGVVAEVWSWGCRKLDESGATEKEVLDACYRHYENEDTAARDAAIARFPFLAVLEDEKA